MVQMSIGSEVQYGTAYFIWSIIQSQLQSQSRWSLFNGTWQKRPRELENRLSFEIRDMKLQMQ